MTGSTVWRDQLPIHLFSYTVHTHDKGTGVTVWKTDSADKTVIVDQDPHDQRWYPMHASIHIGDRLIMSAGSIIHDFVVEVK